MQSSVVSVPSVLGSVLLLRGIGGLRLGRLVVGFLHCMTDALCPFLHLASGFLRGLAGVLRRNFGALRSVLAGFAGS